MSTGIGDLDKRKLKLHVVGRLITTIVAIAPAPAACSLHWEANARNKQHCMRKNRSMQRRKVLEPKWAYGES